MTNNINDGVNLARNSTNYEQIFQKSLQRLTENDVKENAFFDQFYEKFISSSPAIREKFINTDFTRQKKILKNSFSRILVLFINKTVDPEFERMVKRHRKEELDIAPYLYEIWLNCLVQTVKNHDPEFTNEVELAWRMVMSLGITYMKFKYDKY